MSTKKSSSESLLDFKFDIFPIYIFGTHCVYNWQRQRLFIWGKGWKINGNGRRKGEPRWKLLTIFGEETKKKKKTIQSLL